ncbi:MAG: alpha/beta fold hydrolase [Candidatus Paracaedibacteraceae bacterium]|nr:alpha/beta fold hydrolase [Candidatus Paracaedibacteraceae bacterium]
MRGRSELWLRRQASKNPKYRIICFPHAGGASLFFRKWGENLPNSEVYSVCYPGRAERIEEEQPTDLRELALEIAKSIEPLSDIPLVLFGHSMGAAVALETARSLEEKGVEIVHLFASGSRNGGLPKKESYVEKDDGSLCKHLVEMGGTDPDVINDPLFLDLVLPSIRADGKMFNEYNMRIEPTLKCSVTTIYGNTDTHVDMRPWREIAPGKFSEECVPGGHFYLTSKPPYNLVKQIVQMAVSAKMKAN